MTDKTFEPMTPEMLKAMEARVLLLVDGATQWAASNGRTTEIGIRSFAALPLLGAWAYLAAEQMQGSNDGQRLTRAQGEAACDLFVQFAHGALYSAMQPFEVTPAEIVAALSGEDEDGRPTCFGCGAPLTDEEIAKGEGHSHPAEEVTAAQAAARDPLHIGLPPEDTDKVLADRHKLVALAEELATASGSDTPVTYAGTTLLMAAALHFGQDMVKAYDGPAPMGMVMQGAAALAQFIANKMIEGGTVPGSNEVGQEPPATVQH